MCAIAFLLLIEVRSIVDYVMIFKGRGLKMGVFVGGGGGGGGVDLDLDFKNFWDGVYNFFFCPPPRVKQKKSLQHRMFPGGHPSKY